MATSIQSQIIAAANAAGIDPNVALAVAQHESGFNPNASAATSGVCPAGKVCTAAGVFQLTAATQKTLGVTNPYDPTQNINAGVSLLAQYYNNYGNWQDALQAFSQGPGTVGQTPSGQTIGLINYVAGQSDSVTPYGSGTTASLPNLLSSTPPTDTSGLDTSGSGAPDPTQAGTFDWSWLLWGGAAALALYFFVDMAEG